MTRKRGHNTTYTGAMVIPQNAVVIRKKDMRYVEGGLTITRRAFSWSVSIAIGAAVGALTAGLGTFVATRGLIVLASYRLRTLLAKAIVKAIGALGIRIGNKVGVIAGGIAGCAGGDLAGYVFDRWIDKRDGKKDGKIRI